MAQFAPARRDPALLVVLEAIIREGRDLTGPQAEELGCQFNLSARSVYRDLATLKSRPDLATAAVAAAGARGRGLKRHDHTWPVLQADQDDNGERAKTVLQTIQEVGPSAFWFDDELVGLAYLYRGNLTRLHRELSEAGYQVPPYSTFYLRWTELLPLIRAGAKKGFKNRFARSLHLRYSSDFAGQVYQLDAFVLDIEVLEQSGKALVRVRPTLLLLIDDRSRRVVGWAVLSHQTRAQDVVTLFGQAFETWTDEETGAVVGGVPELLIVDNEAAIVARLVNEALETIPTAIRPSPAYTPIVKGKVERAGQTIQSMICTAIPGFRSESELRDGSFALELPDHQLLHFGDLVRLVESKIAEYNATPMRVLGGRTRHRAYVEDFRSARSVPRERLAAFMSPVSRGGKRKVLRHGVEFEGMFFVAPELALYVGDRRHVSVCAWHHQRDWVAVYDPSGRFLCAADRVDLLPEERVAKVLGDRFAAEKKAAAAISNARKLMAVFSEEQGLDIADTDTDTDIDIDIDTIDGDVRPDEEPQAEAPVGSPKLPAALEAIADQELKLGRTPATKPRGPKASDRGAASRNKTKAANQRAIAVAERDEVAARARELMQQAYGQEDAQ